MSNWMRLATNQFDGSGNFIVSNSVSGQRGTISTGCSYNEAGR